MWLCLFLCRWFKETCEKEQWRKVKQMWSVWLCILLCKQFTEACDKSQRWKVKQLWPVWLCIYLCNQFTETFQSAQRRKVKQMQPACMRFERSIYSGENLTNATSVLMNLLRDEIWRRLLKYTVQPMWLCLLWIRLFEETFERARWRKTIKSNHCDFASLWANALTKHMKMHVKVWHQKD